MKFDLGKVLMTPAAAKAINLAGQEPSFFLSKHAVGDWGSLEPGDKARNDQALIDGERILSTYRTLRNERILVITEADRSVTTILLIAEY